MVPPLPGSHQDPLFQRGRFRPRDPGKPGYRPEPGRTDIKAGTALGAFSLVNYMDLALATDDGLRGAAPQTYHAGLAFLRFNVVGGKCFRGEGRAALLPGM